jgi:hypothetical protein
MVWWACISHPLTQPVPEPEQQTDIYITVAPIRKLDLVFMVDNSPSMAPKVQKMNDQFNKLILALKDPTDGTYPDLRVALIDSDLGTGGAYNSGSCGPNDSNGQNPYGDLGNFQMRDSVKCGMKSADSLWIEYTKGAPVNYNGNGDQINNVFGCLASNLGTVGCGEEHQLQAYEFALVAQNLHTDKFATQNTFLRPTAYLGLVFLSDEDDCSAATNDGMFGDKNDLRGESASLRCSTRAHACNGKNLSDNGPEYPTKQAFQASFGDCAARTDACLNKTDGEADTDTSVPTNNCSPLKSVQKLAQKMKDLKGDQASEKILVAGIFGWPLAGADGKADFTKAEPYKIDLVPNPNTADTAHPQVYDYWPVCYDPGHRPKTAGAFDQDAWGYGAEGGLRMSAFIDQFGDNGLKYSICEKDFTGAMQGIGGAIAKKLQNLCVDEKLYDTDLDPNNSSLADLVADCRVVFRRPVVDDKTGKVTFVEDAKSMVKCKPGSTNGKVDQDCWQLTIDHKKCEVNGQLIQVLRTAQSVADNPTLPEGTKVGMQCRTCPDANTVALLDQQSDTYRACSYAAIQ